MIKLKARSNEFFFGQVSTDAVGLLRLFVGAAMLCEAILIFPSLDGLYGPNGFLSARLMGAIGSKTVPFYAAWFAQHGISYSTLLYGIFSVRVLALLFFTAGVAALPSCFLLWLTQIFFIYSGEMSSYGVDRYYHLLLFLMLFAPISDSYSLRSWRGRTQKMQTALSLRAIQMAILITYIDAGFSKAKGEQWWSGEAIWRVANLPEFHQWNMTWLAGFPLLLKALSVGTIFLEGFYFLGILIPGVGTLWILSIIAMHLGIALFMGLVNFGVTMALVNVAIFLQMRFKKTSHVASS